MPKVMLIWMNEPDLILMTVLNLIIPTWPRLYKTHSDMLFKKKFTGYQKDILEHYSHNSQLNAKLPWSQAVTEISMYLIYTLTRT